MSAPAAPESEPSKLTHADATTSSTTTPHEPPSPTASTAAQANGDPTSFPAKGDHDPRIKDEDCTSVEPVDEQPEDGLTATTLRASPPLSFKRRQSLAATSAMPEGATVAAPSVDQHLMPLSEVTESKKRKRVSSPPWQFPSVETATVKTADGRRTSARVNTGTPGLSESDGRGRSSSLSASRSRPPSPPWKKFAADRPTSVNVDGVRKSGRVNKELGAPEKPTRISPRQKKQAERMAAYANNTMSGTQPTRSKRAVKTERAESPSSKIAQLQAQIAALDGSNSPEPEIPFNTGDRKRKRYPEPAVEAKAPGRMSRKHVAAPSPEQSRSTPRLKLRLGLGARHDLPHPHPLALAPSPPLSGSTSLQQRLDELDLHEMQQPYSENEHGPPDAAEFERRNQRQATLEGEMRQKLIKAAEQEGPLSRERLDLFGNEPVAEPAPQYGHNDHLANHALYLRHLQVREKERHRALAKKVAQEALEYWRARRGPTEDDLRAEEDRIFKLVYKQVVLDIRARWEMVANHVLRLKREKWEVEEAARRQEKLQKQLEQAEAMVARQRGGDDDSILADDTSDLDPMSDEHGSTSGSDEEEEDGSEDENMSATDTASSSEEDEIAEDMSEDALAAYLAHREDSSKGGVDHASEDPNDGRPEADNDARTPDTADRGDSASAPDKMARSTTSITRTNSSGDLELLQQRRTSDAHPRLQITVTADASDAELEGNGTRRARASLSAEPTAEERQVEAELSDDESTDMDSESYDSDEDMSDTDDDQAEAGSGDGDVSSAEDDEDAGLSTLGFLLDRNEIKAIGLPTPTTSAEGDAQDRKGDLSTEDHPTTQQGAFAETQDHEDAVADGQTSHDMADVEEASHDIVGETNGIPQVADPPGGELQPDSSMQEDTVESHGKALVPSPSLLRGHLRSYQHAGVDWLASLYRNGTNGILADEMGLGKTIQTIALLAHLAEVHSVWEPHLVIVPTSVILNWVTEFQKFLPGFRVLGYYGSADDRAAKRKGWVNDPHHEDRSKRGYNVIITSYNVAMQDINAIRNVQWHYLVLDEAHNIRNFNSQRWQVLIRLRTRARLLLTGTPLQNSLTELWSLLTFLTAGNDDPAHGDLEEFLSHWKEPVKEIFDRGVSTLSTEAQKVVDQLHVSLRPFLLRRLKSEVEKDLPKKTESVVVCKLSKRQRQLYQEYMGLTSTRDSLARGNAVTAGKVLMSLRRVCNHPDLFDPRPIQTSFAMEQSPLEPFKVKERIIRRMLGSTPDLPSFLTVTEFEDRRTYILRRRKQLSATHLLEQEARKLEVDLSEAPEAGTLAGCHLLRRHQKREHMLGNIRNGIRATTLAVRDTPAYGIELRELVTIHRPRSYSFLPRRRIPAPVKSLRGWPCLGQRPLTFDHLGDWLLSTNTRLQQDVLSLDRYAESLHDIIVRFAFSPPVVTAPTLDFAIPAKLQEHLRLSGRYPLSVDYGHEARIRTSIAFPDSRLLMYDSGKLQRLKGLLRDLQAKGSRSLIFTQMAGTLNVLERFLGLLNLPYLRLDGSTPVEKRQLNAAEFNRPDSKYQCMILSSRAGGVGLNLTGASSVIFYDLDWNPQMDRQCMDRAHRIGQVRDVEVFKMVSEKTVEENILRRADQKSLLDQTVIQQGNFTTDYHRYSTRAATGSDEDEDEVTAAIERFLGGGDKATMTAMESVEDKEDVVAAQQARKEEHQDDVDFAEHRSSKGQSHAATPAPGFGEDDEDDERQGHVDEYMVSWMQEMTRHQAFVPPQVRRLDKNGRDPSHRPKKRR